MSGISPGAYLLDRVVNLPTGFYVREAKFDHKDVLNEPVQVTGDHVGELEIVLSRRTGQLEGVALDVQSRAARNAQVALVPAQRNRTDLYRTLLTDANGAFRFGSVPPGDYRVFAWDALDSYAYFDQDLLRRLESQSVPVHISDSTKTNVTVRTTPAQ
jgi:hypothetical protein